MTKQKDYKLNIYKSDGTFKGKISLNALKSKITFPPKLNKGLGQMTMSLIIDEGFIDYELFDFVKVIVYTEGKADTDRIIYTGNITQDIIEEVRQGKVIERTMNLLGQTNLLTIGLYTDGQSVNDAGEIIKSIIDDFNTRNPESSNWIHYDSESIDITGDVITVDFIGDTWERAIQKTIRKAGAMWYWKIEKDGKVFVQKRANESKHLFDLGTTIDTFKQVSDIETVINRVLLLGTSTVVVEDVDSINKYWARTQELDYPSVLLATPEAEKIIEENAWPKNKTTITVNEIYNKKLNKKYDLEDVLVGDTCRIQGLPDGVVSEVSQIVSVKYMDKKVILELEGEIANFTEELKKNIQNEQ